MHTATTTTRIPEGNANGSSHSSREKGATTSICIGPDRQEGGVSAPRLPRSTECLRPSVSDTGTRSHRWIGAFDSNRFLHPSGGSTTCSGGVTPHLGPQRDRGDPGFDAIIQHVSKMPLRLFISIAFVEASGNSSMRRLGC